MKHFNGSENRTKGRALSSATAVAVAPGFRVAAFCQADEACATLQRTEGRCASIQYAVTVVLALVAAWAVKEPGQGAVRKSRVQASLPAEPARQDLDYLYVL